MAKIKNKPNQHQPVSHQAIKQSNNQVIKQTSHHRREQAKNKPKWRKQCRVLQQVNPTTTEPHTPRTVTTPSHQAKHKYTHHHTHKHTQNKLEQSEQAIPPYQMHQRKHICRYRANCCAMQQRMRKNGFSMEMTGNCLQMCVCNRIHQK